MTLYRFINRFFISFSNFSLQLSVSDDVEIAKSKSIIQSEDLGKREDQVALESERQEQHIRPPLSHIVQGF
jgi:hypothetical protein